jgi:hypothetical protein
MFDEELPQPLDAMQRLKDVSEVDNRLRGYASAERVSLPQDESVRAPNTPKTG